VRCAMCARKSSSAPVLLFRGFQRADLSLSSRSVWRHLA
jgi:hypothetical protein